MGTAFMNISDYARHRRALGLPGGTRQAVYKAIKASRIRLEANGLICVEQADYSWKLKTMLRMPPIR